MDTVEELSTVIILTLMKIKKRRWVLFYRGGKT